MYVIPLVRITCVLFLDVLFVVVVVFVFCFFFFFFSTNISNKFNSKTEMHDSHSSNNSHNLQKACERTQNDSAEIETSQKSTI